MNNLILEKLTIIEELLFEKKKVLNPVELSKYTGYYKATIYKMVGKLHFSLVLIKICLLTDLTM